MQIAELSLIDRLKLSLEYSISKKHQKSLQQRISEMEGKPVEKKRKKKVNVEQGSFL